MDLFDITQLALQRAAEGVSLRQQTIADNLANANTPGFRRSDVQFHDSLSSAMGSGRFALERTRFSPTVDQTSPVRGDGSNVDIDKEQTTMAQVSLEYDALISVSKARNQILRSAIGGGS